MNFTIKTEYALRALHEVLSGNGKPVNRKQISANQHISEHFLEKICLALKKNNILDSKMGPGGGFTISREPKDISFLEIYKAVDLQDGKFINCYPGIKGECELHENCQIKDIWARFNQKLIESMSNITLADIT
ncbi:MAG: Rrf2 family transcriptional regulator [Candidatus Aminicenantes bacterium]|nr:Rrf2 family transcriptional regulator [Candidatus Aminicenantes bacterium]